MNGISLLPVHGNMFTCLLRSKWYGKYNKNSLYEDVYLYIYNKCKKKNKCIYVIHYVSSIVITMQK